MSTTTSTHASSPDVMTLVNKLTTSCTQNTMETELLRKQYVRKLYALLGNPTKEDFPDEFWTAEASWFDKTPGYTKHIGVMSKKDMTNENNAGTKWCVKRPSQTKLDIVERYVRQGWHCTVRCYVVSCHKFVQHPRYPKVWVLFMSSRDTARYEYILEKPDAQDD